MHKPQVLVLLETRLREENATKHIKKLNHMFAKHELTYGNGFSGGIWVFWNPHQIGLTVLCKSDQQISFTINNIIRGQLKTAIFSSVCLSELGKEETFMARSDQSPKG